MKTKNRILGIDILKIISMISVIFIHVIGNTLYTFNLKGESTIKFYHTIEHLAYFSISLFIIISGYLFLYNKQKIDTKDFFKKHILKIFLIILVFGFGELIIENLFINKNFNISIIPNMFKNILSGNLWEHMWFLYMILGIYLLTPFLKSYFDSSNKTNITFTLIVLFIFTILLPFISDLFKIKIAYTLPINSAYLFYFIFGGYLGKYDINTKTKYLLYSLSLLFVIFIIFNYYIKEIQGFNTIISYISPFTIAFASIVFIKLKNIDIKNLNIKKAITCISECSLGIYIIHQFYINIIYKFLKFDLILKMPYLGLLMYSTVILIITFFTVLILRKIKLIKKYLL